MSSKKLVKIKNKAWYYLNCDSYGNVDVPCSFTSSMAHLCGVFCYIESININSKIFKGKKYSTYKLSIAWDKYKDPESISQKLQGYTPGNYTWSEPMFDFINKRNIKI